MRSRELNPLPQLLTLQCSYDSPCGEQRRQNQPWTDFPEKKVGRKFWTDIWPRVSLRLLYDVLGDDIHEKDGETDLILCISQMEILLEASNARISYNQAILVIYTS